MNNMTKKLPTGRPRSKHGGFTYLTKARMGDDKVYLLRYLTATRQALLHDLGQNLSSQKLILVDRVISLLGVVRLIEEECRVEGVFQSRNLTSSLSHHYIAFNNSLTRMLNLLGLERVPEPAKAVSEQEFVDKIYGKKKKK